LKAEYISSHVYDEFQFLEVLKKEGEFIVALEETSEL